MPEHHIFVETNWVVALVYPTLSYDPGAEALLDRSRREEIVLHLPAVSLGEAHKVVRERTPRIELDVIREFVRSRQQAGEIDVERAGATFEVLSRFQQHVAREKQLAPVRIAELLREPVDAFALDQQMLDRSIQIAAGTGLALESFDLAILAAVLVRGEAFHAAGARVSFCTRDSHLQPWDKKGARKRELAELFDAAGVWVYGDFLLDAPTPPEAWPSPDLVRES